MKKRIIAVCIALFFAGAVGAANWIFGNPGGVSIDYNGCTVYPEEDIDSAARVVIESFKSKEGCVLFSLKYAGNGELEYCRSLSEEADYTECLVFESVFRSPLKSYGAWETNEIYTWDWYLAREKGGEWQLVTAGYA